MKLELSSAQDTKNVMEIVLDRSVIDRVLTRYESKQPFSTIERERIIDYVYDALTKRMLDTNAKQLNCNENLRGFVHTFATSCIRSGISEVVRRKGVQERGLARLYVPQHFGESEYETYRTNERAECIFLLIEHMNEINSDLYAKRRNCAQALIWFLEIPQVYIPSRENRRFIAQLCKNTQGRKKIVNSLQEAYDLVYRAKQSKLDPRLIDLWADYSKEDMITLLHADKKVVTAIVQGTAGFSPKPRAATRIMFRKQLKQLSQETGWSSLMMGLERSFIATYFDTREEFNRVERRSEEELEVERSLQASMFPYFATKAMTFHSNPMNCNDRDDHRDVAARLWEVLRHTVRESQGKCANRSQLSTPT